MVDRRNFLSSLAGFAAFPSFALQGATHAGPIASRCLADGPMPLLPRRDLYDRDEDAFWAALRNQFLIPLNEVYLNNGTVGSSPYPVLKGIFDSFLQTEQMAQANPEEYPIWGYEPYVLYRDALAQFVGATRDQIALTRNATESNNYIANGLEMKPGDEVLMSDQEHPGGEEPWKMRARRYGVVVKQFEIPKPPKNSAEILNRISDAITPRTRIIFVSHITTVTGVVLPAREIATLARSKGIISAFDGAHVTGMMGLNLNDLGCDLYTSSPHKWLQAPKGTGFLYLRDDAIMNKLWNTIATHGWDEPDLKAERFQHIGSSNVPILAGLKAAIEFANWIGMERIEKRHRALGDLIYQEMLKRGAESWTSPDPALRCGIVTVNVPPARMPDLEYWMWKQHKVRIRGGAPHKVRLSTPYYLQKSDIQRFLEKLDEYKNSSQRSAQLRHPNGKIICFRFLSKIGQQISFLAASHVTVPPHIHNLKRTLMNFQSSAQVLAIALLIAFACHPSPAHAQATITCPSGQWDMVDVMTMDQSLINANYHLSGTHTDFTTGTTSAVYDKMFVPGSNTGSLGKLYYVKSFQNVSGLGRNPNDPSGLYGYPWDINLYDSKYAYLWITEQTFAEPWAYKKFNSGSSDYSMRFVRRCVVPGDSTTSVIVNPPPSQNSTNNTQFIIQPQTPTGTASDCSAPSKTSQLGWNVMQVFANETSALTFHDDVHGTTSSIDLLPVSYRYNCSNGSPGPTDCGDKEEFDYNNTYGLVQWKHWKLQNGSMVLVEQSVHDHLKPDDGNRGFYFPCF